MDDIFEDTNLNLDPEKDYYEELVGEGRKYKDNKALAFSNVHKDAFIEQLKTELEETRNEVQTRLNLEQFLTDLKTVVPKPGSNDSQDHFERNDDKTVMSDEELAALVRKQVMAMKGQETAASNLSNFSTMVQSAYGPNAAAKLRSQALELGMTVDEVKALAARNPKAATKLLGIGEQRPVDTFDTPPRSQSMSLPQGGNKRGASYFESIRKSKPDEYFTPKIQNERFEMIKQMGLEAFNNS